MKVSVSVAGAWLLLALSGCGGPPEEAALSAEWGETEAPLVKGTATCAHPEVGALVLSAHSLCTATLVAPDVVLTAGHCYAGKSGTRTKDHFFSLEDCSGQRFNYPADHFYSLGTQRFFDTDQDLALTHLSQPVPESVAKPVPIARAAARGKVTAVGYGCTRRSNPQEGVGQKRERSFTWGSYQSFTCPGDSGGPILNGKGEVVAVISTATKSDWLPLPDLAADPIRHRVRLMKQLAAWVPSTSMTCGDYADAAGWKHPACDNGSGVCQGTGTTTVDCQTCCGR